MGSLLKRDEHGFVVERECNYPDKDGDKVLYNQCNGCTNINKCTADIFERLAKYEESGLEPETVKAIASRNTVVEVCPR